MTHFNHFILRKMNPKRRKWLKKCKDVLTKHRFQELVLSACRDRDDEWRMSVMGLVEFLRDC